MVWFRRLHDGENQEIVHMSSDSLASPHTRSSSRKRLLLCICGGILVFVVGFIAGYLVKRSVSMASSNAIIINGLTSLRDYSPQISENLRREVSGPMMQETLKEISNTVHLAGTDASRKVADFLFNHHKLDIAKKETFEIVLSYPPNKGDVKRNKVVLKDGTGADKIVSDDRIVNFNGFSPAKTVSGDLVYVNNGVPEDFERLKELNVTVKGNIAIIRYGKIFRGNKVENAFNEGATGVILYSDPYDYRYNTSVITPDGHGSKRYFVVYRKV